jgi:Ca2+-binding RTX toxin-like protein
VGNTVTPLADGGRLESWTQDNTTHLQKYDASGAAVGAQLDVQTQGFTPEIVALSNGGFVVSTGYVIRGGVYSATVFDAAAKQVASVDMPGSGIGFHLAASPEGGFLVVSMDQHYDGSGTSNGVDLSWRPFLTLYDNAGQVTHAPVGLAGALPTVSVTVDGHYQVQWQDGDIAHSLNIDPQHPPALDKPAAPTLTLIDDQGAHTGAITNGYTTDLTPVARVSVTAEGWVEVRRESGFSGSAVEHQITGGVRVTAADVARGYVDVPTDPTAVDGAPYTFFARFKSLDGVVSDPDTHQLNMFRVPEIWSVSDNVGSQQGEVAAGTTTDDATLTLRVGLESSGLHAGDPLVVRDQGVEVARVILTGDDAARGYVDVTTSVLADGAHTLSVANTPATPAFNVTVAAASASQAGGGQGEDIVSPGPGSTVTGTAGADTIHASQGPDVITGGGGADVIAFHDLPWNSGHITDFVVGTDKLDLSAIFQASGYVGSDPVADGRMRFDDDGAGGTKVYFDHDQLNGGDWPFLITTLDHVSPTGLTWAQLSAGGSTGGGGSTGTGTGDPPPSGGTPGQVITSDQYGDTLTGGAGNDTLNAGQGPDVLTGGGGDDMFAFHDLPWRATTITDFTPGHDVLDLRPLFSASGYAGSDPLADHRLEFRDDGQGGTAVYFDPDGPNTGEWPFFVATLTGVTPGQIGSGDWLFH